MNSDSSDDAGGSGDEPKYDMKSCFPVDETNEKTCISDAEMHIRDRERMRVQTLDILPRFLD